MRRSLRSSPSYPGRRSGVASCSSREVYAPDLSGHDSTAFCYTAVPKGKCAGKVVCSSLLSFPDLGDRRGEEELEEPVGGDAGAALRALQLVQVGEPPEQGGHPSAELYPHNLVDGELAPHLHELAQRPVLEGLEFLAVYSGQHVSCDGPALLGRGLRVGWHGAPVLLHVGRAVADAPDVVVTLDAHVGVHRKALALVVGEVEIVQLLARAGSGGPDGVLGLYLPPVVQYDLLGGDLLRLYLVYDLDLEVRQLLAGRPPQGRVELLEDLLVTVDEDYPDPVRVDVRVVGGEDLVNQLVQLRGRLYARGTAAYDDEGQLRVGDLAAGQGRLLVALDDPVAYLLGRPDTLHADGVLLDARYTEVGRLTAQGYDEVFVRELPPVGRDALLLEVYAPDLGAPEAGPVPDQGPPQRLRDVLGVYVAAYDPREYRPEGEIVLPGDEHHANVVAVPGMFAQRLGRGVAGEPAAQDQNPIREFPVRGPLPRLVPRARLRKYRPPQDLRAHRTDPDRESPLERLVHAYSFAPS